MTKKKTTQGGARPGAGRPVEMNKGKRIGVYVEQDDLRQLEILKVKNISLFYRTAAKREIKYAIKKQQKLDI